MTSIPGGPRVVIVGAGPAGLVIAHLLQREAVPFVVFERQELAELRRVPKAGLIEYRTVQLLASAGRHVPPCRFAASAGYPHRARARSGGT